MGSERPLWVVVDRTKDCTSSTRIIRGSITALDIGTLDLRLHSNLRFLVMKVRANQRLQRGGLGARRSGGPHVTFVASFCESCVSEYHY